MTAVSERAFQGNLILFRQVDALDALLDHAREIAFAAFADPVGDEGRLESAWREKAMSARRAFALGSRGLESARHTRRGRKRAAPEPSHAGAEQHAGMLTTMAREIAGPDLLPSPIQSATRGDWRAQNGGRKP